MHWYVNFDTIFDFVQYFCDDVNLFNIPADDKLTIILILVYISHTRKNVANEEFKAFFEN